MLSETPDEEDTRSSPEEHTIVAEPTPAAAPGSAVCAEWFPIRWRILLLICLLGLGNYYTFDCPGAIGMSGEGSIRHRFADKGLHYSSSMNQLLYSVYSWPNTVLALVGGCLIDGYLGLRRATLLFSLLVTLGSILLWLGVWGTNFELMVVARIIFGIGGESLGVAQQSHTARWFNKQRGMAFAFGITLSFLRVGSALNFLISPPAASLWGPEGACLIGVTLCAFSLAAGIVLIACDVYAVSVGYLPEESVAQREEQQTNERLLSPDGAVPSIGTSEWVLGGIPARAWLLSLICVAVYCAIAPYMGIGAIYFEVKYGFSPKEAAGYQSIYMLTGVVGSPLLGGIVDLTGRNALWLLLACSLFVVVHSCFLLTMLPGPAILVLMGLSSGVLGASLWPSIPLVVESGRVAFAYGAMGSVQNTGLAIFPAVVGSILNAYTPEPAPGAAQQPVPDALGFQLVERLFVASAGVAVVFAVVLAILDHRLGGKLTAGCQSPAGPAARTDWREEPPTENHGAWVAVETTGF